MNKSKKIKHHSKKPHSKKHHSKKPHSKKNLYRKRREIQSVPGARGVPIFSPPEKKNNTPIIDILNLKDDIKMIPGLKNYLKNQK